MEKNKYLIDDFTDCEWPAAVPQDQPTFHHPTGHNPPLLSEDYNSGDDDDDDSQCPDDVPEVNLKNVLTGIVAIVTGRNKDTTQHTLPASNLAFIGSGKDGDTYVHPSVYIPSAPPLLEPTGVNYNAYKQVLEAEPPDWLRDSTAKVCMQCNAPFTALTRGRHHCRFCGGIFCRACSKGRCLLPVKFRERNPQRVCDTCYDMLDPLQGVLINTISNAVQVAKHDVMDWTCSRGWLNLPVGLSMEHEIYKSSNTLRNYCQVARLNPERSIPAAVLKGAKGLAILTVAKAGMLLTYKLGTGLVMSRRADGSWSAPSAIISAGLGWGPQVRSFRTKNDVDAWLLANPMKCPGALHFVERNSSVISYGLQTNSTPIAKRGDFEDPTFKFQIPLQIAAEREIARSLIGDPGFSWVVNLKEFAHPVVETFSSVGTVGPSFFLAIAMFGFVLQISSLIVEKELKLRQAMAIMGLYDTAYWLSWLTWEGIITLLSSLFTVLFGMMFQFDFFLNNSFAVVFFVFFLFQLNMVGFAFMFSSFITKSTSSTTVGFSVYIVGFLTQIVTAFGFPYSDNYSDTYRAIWSLYPPNLLAKALQLLSDATSTPQDPGISWASKGKCAPNDTECLISVNDIYIWLLATFILWVALAIYFDNIFPNSSGVRKPIFYFLNPGYWSGKGGNGVKEGRICSCMRSLPPSDQTSPDDEDVLEEENTVKRQHREGLVDPNLAVQIQGLVKVYPGTTNIGCFNCKKTAPYHALKGLWVNFPKDQLFCLLGPNGAGKTTAINCLTGITPVTEGDALIYGHSIRSSVGMSNIQKMIGVCPQFDILWDALSGQEHLYLFASIKGLPPSSFKTVVQKSLAEVRLSESARVRTRSYSGGMKRRLSVAIALIGEPKLVILDEPTTGMDPITRRHVWDIIENAKKGRAIILTTHSMEEADILSDRIGIMTKGRLRCIGNSIRLKSRFGTGYIANVSFSGTTADITASTPHEEVKMFFKERLDVLPKEENKSFLTFVIPHDKEGLLTNFFEELENRVEEFGISDIQLSLTTLEEVFLNIAKQAEFESAAAEGRFTTLTLTSGTSLQIPVGARFIGIPETISTENPRGSMVEVFWGQDDAGALCISGHSNETPIPPHVQLSNAPSRRNFFRRSGPVHGIVIDPNEIGNPTS